MKKILAIILVLVLMFSFVACGTDKAENADTTDKVEDTTKADTTAGATADVDAGATTNA